MRNRIRVDGWNTPFTSRTVGKEFYIHFDSYNQDPGQYTIEPDTDDPLLGTDLQYTGETVVPFNKNLLFYPIPFDMLETFEEKPQMLVTVGGLPAVCHNVTCDFVHIASVGEVTGFSYDDASNRTLTITGTNLPTNSSDIQSITFAGSNCTVINAGADGALSGT